MNSSIDRVAEADIKPEMSAASTSSPSAEWPPASTTATCEYPPRQQCASCLRPVGRDELVRRVAVASSDASAAGRREVSVHVRCLRCAACERELCTGERAYVLAGRPVALALYCEPDYERLAATVAATADAAITSRGTHSPSFSTFSLFLQVLQV